MEDLWSLRDQKLLEVIILSALIASATTLGYVALYPKLKTIIEKRRAPRYSKVRVPYNVAIVDASNVALYGSARKGKGSLSNILMMIKVLEDKGFKVYAVADASLRHKIDEPNKYEKLVQAGKIIQVPPSTPADYFILSMAEAEHGIVVSNDAFREWRDQFPWVKDRIRVVRYLIEGNRVYLYPDVKPKRKWKPKQKRRRIICIDLEETQEDYWKRYIM
ncbi:hypothetical protein IPA_09315 [Ignicoccus pacificus DSM 13166]|uniref:RNase NYN domain-containing protein n=1 Tax=Ignicoccus pacificus DSM 13166 TaxID=940294 RepID=A0A977PLE0_9CREN|nr:hypothetical protein IPA_09315 [Ignicoccus pacificus DSM 13166]